MINTKHQQGQKLILSQMDMSYRNLTIHNATFGFL